MTGTQRVATLAAQLRSRTQAPAQSTAPQKEAPEEDAPTSGSLGVTSTRLDGKKAAITIESAGIAQSPAMTKTFQALAQKEARRSGVAVNRYESLKQYGRAASKEAAATVEPEIGD